MHTQLKTDIFFFQRIFRVPLNKFANVGGKVWGVPVWGKGGAGAGGGVPCDLWLTISGHH